MRDRDSDAQGLDTQVAPSVLSSLLASSTMPVLNTQGSLRPWLLGETKHFPGECILLPFIPDTELCVYLCT